MDLIIFPDPEVLVGDYLQAGLAARGITRAVSTKAPTEMHAAAGRDPYIRIMVTGGAAAGQFLDDAQITIECYSDSEQDASDTASLARAILHYMGRDPLSGAHTVTDVSRPVNLPDLSGLARYTFTITARITPLRS